MPSGMTTNQPQMFELEGLFATVDTIPTTPIAELDLPRDVPVPMKHPTQGEPTP